VHNQNYKIEVI